MEQMYKTPNEGMRQLLEIAICCGRCWQSSQTGFIHYCYSLKDENAHHPIPTYENFIFALALFRSRSAENIADGKELLKRLLHFQSHEGEMSGNFPVYLHDYPFCKDRLWGAHILVVIYWIYKNFHHVLGADLKQALKMALIRLQNYCLKTIDERPSLYPISLKIASCAKAVGPLLNQSEIGERGDQLFYDLEANRDKSTWFSPTSLSDLILAYQILPAGFVKEFEKPFSEHLLATWHTPTSSYCGPGWKEYQRGNQPQVTLYDYYMGYISGTYSFRCFIDHPVQLQAALVFPEEERLKELTYPFNKEGMLNGLPWQLVQKKDYAYSLLAKESSAIPVQEKTFFPLKLIWGSPKLLHSFVCQGGTSESISFKSSEKHLEINFSFSTPPNVDDNEKNQEVCFYVDEDVSTSLTVEGSPATTFKLSDKIIITSGHLKFSLSFQVALGSGEFFGHIMKGNRPSQYSITGVHRFSAYDWQIYLRTIHRTEECVIKAILQFMD